MKLLRTSSLSIRVQPSFFILAFLFALFIGVDFSVSFLIMGIVFLVFFFHELGHIIVARLLGRPCETVISGAGGRTEVFGPRMAFWRRAIVLVGGVLSTYFVIVGSRMWLFDAEALSPIVREGVYLLYSLSVGWFWFNLLPLYPFDGGELALDIGRSLFGRRGEQLAAIVSILTALLLAVYLSFIGVFVIVILCLYCMTQSFAVIRHPPRILSDDLSEDALRLHELRQQWLAGEQDAVIAQMERLAEESGEKEVRQAAVECCSGYLLATDQPRAAYDMLIRAKDPLTQPALEHLQLASYKTSHWLEGLEAGREAFRECHSLPVATMCAMLAARLQLADEAIAWLQAADRLGLHSLSSLIASSDFDSIRDQLSQLSPPLA